MPFFTLEETLTEFSDDALAEMAHSFAEEAKRLSRLAHGAHAEDVVVAGFILLAEDDRVRLRVLARRHGELRERTFLFRE